MAMETRVRFKHTFAAVVLFSSAAGVPVASLPCGRGVRSAGAEPDRGRGASGYTAEIKFTTASGKQDLKLANERYDHQLQGVGCWVLLVVET
jgi:hypothetical protein